MTLSKVVGDLQLVGDKSRSRIESPGRRTSFFVGHPSFNVTLLFLQNSFQILAFLLKLLSSFAKVEKITRYVFWAGGKPSMNFSDLYKIESGINMSLF